MRQEGGGTGGGLLVSSAVCDVTANHGGKLLAYVEESERAEGNSSGGRGGIGGSHLHDKYWQDLARTPADRI